jgi:hypothetical protein
LAKISRRYFLKIGTGAVLASLLPKSFAGLPEQNKPVIAVAHGDKSKLVQAAVNALGGIDKFISPGDRVCIKPNISFAANIDCGATTSLGIVDRQKGESSNPDQRKTVQ